MTLILIATTAVMLVGLARQSLLLAMEAVEAQEALQQRWATVSLQQEVLRRAAELFAEQDLRFREKQATGPLPMRMEAVVPLGGQIFSITLSDEDAKINLNTCFRHLERPRVTSLVQQVSRTSQTTEVRLRPYRVNRDDETLPAFDSWGQVFSLDAEGGMLPTTLTEATEELTCWGSGRLHVLRASDESVEQVCRLAVTGGTISRLLDLRRRSGSISLAELWQQLQLRESELEDLQQLLTDKSTCYSLWIHGRENKRSSSSFHVAHFFQGGSHLLSFGM